MTDVGFFWCVINVFKRQKSTALFFWHEPDINYLHMSFSMFNYFDSNMEAKTINLPKISYSHLERNDHYDDILLCKWHVFSFFFTITVE